MARGARDGNFYRVCGGTPKKIADGLRAWVLNPSAKNPLPTEAFPLVATRIVNQVTRAAYTIEQVRAMANDPGDADDVALAMTLHEALRERFARGLKHPNVKQAPEVAMLIEILQQLI